MFNTLFQGGEKSCATWNLGTPVFSKEGFAPLVAGLISMIVLAMCNQVAIAAACR